MDPGLVRELERMVREGSLPLSEAAIMLEVSYDMVNRWFRNGSPFKHKSELGLVKQKTLRYKELTYNGVIKTAEEWAKFCGVGWPCFDSRINKYGEDSDLVFTVGSIHKKGMCKRLGRGTKEYQALSDKERRFSLEAVPGASEIEKAMYKKEM